MMTFTSKLSRQAHRPSLGARGNSSSEMAMPIDTSLTSLNWLVNLRVLDLVTPDVAIPISPIPEDECILSKCSPNKEYNSAVGVSLSPVRKCLIQCAEFRRAPRKYRTDSSKPPFSETTLICLAIKHSRTGRVTLSEVFKWIRVNFKFYRLMDSLWEDSIRHNLSLNDLFVKVSQANGRGSYWRINPDYSQTFHETCSTLLGDVSKARKRTFSTCHESRAPKIKKRRVKSESTYPADPCGLPGDLDWVSLLSSQRVGCASCPSESCRPSFGSPVLGTPDLGHIGEPVVCSPLVATLASDVPAYPPVCESNGALLEEAVLRQDSPPLGILPSPWDNSQSQSPTDKHYHPWAESKEKTLYELRNLSKRTEPVPTYVKTSMWSPESSWSSSSTYSTAGIKKQAPLLSEACIY